MPFNTKRKCFKPLQKQECVKWGNCRTRVSQQDGTNVCYKCCLSCRCIKAYSVIACIRLCELREFAACLPIEVAAVHNNAAECSTVSSYKLCCRMNNYVNSVVKCTKKIRCCKSCICHKRNIVPVCYFCKCVYINKV